MNISVCDFQRDILVTFSFLVFINFIKSIVFFLVLVFFCRLFCVGFSWISSNWRWNGNSTVDCCRWCIHSFAVAVEIYLSPVETHCSNVDYFPDMDDEKLQPNDDAITRLHLARSCVALFVLRWVNYTHISIACVCIWHTQHTMNNNGRCIANADGDEIYVCS